MSKRCCLMSEEVSKSLEMAIKVEISIDSLFVSSQLMTGELLVLPVLLCLSDNNLLVSLKIIIWSQKKYFP